MLSHELRTPLAIIDGKAQRLMRKTNSLTADRILESALTIKGSVRRLTDLMEGVLNVSCMEEGRIDMIPEAFDLTKRIEEVVSGYLEVNPGRRIEMALGTMPKAVEGDPRLLIQVISNLVSNAVKYSETDSLVRVEGYLENDKVVVAVHDEGVGIPKDEIDKLCQRFFRARSSAGTAGTGIGLHFIKHLIEMHGGGMDIESIEGVGSSFIVRLPHRLPGEAGPELAALPAVSPAPMSPALSVH